MKQNRAKIISQEKHRRKINKSLTGYWSDDLWKYCDCPIQLESKKKIPKEINFAQLSNENVKNEIKYFYYNRITKGQNIFGYLQTELKFLISFLNEHFSNINSLININQDQFLLKYRTFLLKHNKAITEKGKNHYKHITTEYLAPSKYITLYNQIYSFLQEYYDDREEVEKDRWDVRKLNIDYNTTRSDYHIDFTRMPTHFRPLVKKYIKIRLLIQGQITWGTATDTVYHLQNFFTFIDNKHPSWLDLKMLQRSDIEDFISFLRTSPIGGSSPHGNKNKKSSNSYINRRINIIENFLEIIQRYEWDEAPIKSVRSLVYEEDKPKCKKRSIDSYKYIPDKIWDQLIDNVQNIPREYVPIILIMEASGFRVTDVLALKSNCLLLKEDGWWLVGQQRKVKHEEHRVPISQEIANVIKGQQEIIKSTLGTQANHANYLFPMLTGKRKGQPISPFALVNNLNKLAYKCNILDDEGNIYIFKNHAFRHRYGVNLINNGMNILHVQKLMAHASPEMTLVYAQIHDTTLRTEWEKARNNGAVRLDEKGHVVDADINEQALENGLELEWIRHNLDSIRLDHGFCIKSPKVECDYLNQTLEPPCIKNNCRSFHVDFTFLDYYDDQIKKIESDIELYKKSNRIRSIQLIQTKLSRYIGIRNGLLNNENILGLSKGRREYGEEERKLVNNNG